MRRVPTRTCVSCRTARPKRDLVRIVRMPDGHLTVDATGRVAGRGAYLCADGACWKKARDRGTIARALDVPGAGDLAAILAAGPPADRSMMTTEGGARGQE